MMRTRGLKELLVTIDGKLDGTSDDYAASEE